MGFLMWTVNIRTKPEQPKFINIQMEIKYLILKV